MNRLLISLVRVAVVSFAEALSVRASHIPEFPGADDSALLFSQDD